MIRVLITGSQGQLGRILINTFKNDATYQCTGIDKDELDLTSEIELNSYFNDHSYDYIINCAAFTAVDLAEQSRDKAYAVNAVVPGMLEKICRKYSCKLIHISTDYIYNGNYSVPHTEEEIPFPESVYAESKLEGEKPLWTSEITMIIRTSWLYSEFGNNFLKTMIRLSHEKKEISVVFDQTGTPTYAGDLAGAIFQIVRFSETNGFSGGIFNYSGEGVCSWYDFALEIMKYSGSDCTIRPIRTKDYPLPAKRPAYSVLDKTKIKRKFDLKIPYWRDSMKTAIDQLKIISS